MVNISKVTNICSVVMSILFDSECTLSITEITKSINVIVISGNRGLQRVIMLTLKTKNDFIAA